MQKAKTITVDIICILFILLFIYAAVSKLLDYENFKAQLGRSTLLSRFWNWIWIVPTVEILIAILLPIPKTRLLGLYGSFSLMTMFTVYIIAILQFSEFIPCSCGGVLQKMSWTEHLWFNVIFILLAFTGIVLESRKTVAR